MVRSMPGHACGHQQGGERLHAAGGGLQPLQGRSQLQDGQVGNIQGTGTGTVPALYLMPEVFFVNALQGQPIIGCNECSLIRIHKLKFRNFGSLCISLPNSEDSEIIIFFFSRT